MKIIAVVLVMLGVVAAGAATILVQMFRMNPHSREAPMVDVLVVKADLPARTALTGEHLAVERVPVNGLPPGYFTNQTQALGKVLKTAVIQGQPLAASCCVAKGSIDDLLKPGMLAFPAPLPKRSTSVDLLYPGCIVDVFATFPLSRSNKGEAVVTPLLQNIQVLALEDETVIPVSNEKGALKTVKRSSSSGQNVTVTLEVSARQVSALQLALEQGTLGLAMRNPLDKNLNPMEPMLIKEGQLTAGSEAMDPVALALVGRLQQMLNGNRWHADPNGPAGMMPVGMGPEQNVPSTLPGYLANVSQRHTAWPITVIRGAKVEETEIAQKQETATEPNDAKQSSPIAQRTGR
jgi:Flp pilus assembly protein CpaB